MLNYIYMCVTYREDLFLFLFVDGSTYIMAVGKHQIPLQIPERGNRNYMLIDLTRLNSGIAF